MELTNTSAQPLSGVLHLAIVERHRPIKWMDMEVVDFVCRAMVPSVDGQAMTIGAGANASSTQEFSLRDDWNYCWIVAFFQTADKRILQGAMEQLESTIPTLKMTEGPLTGSLWIQNSTHTVAWSSDRPLGAIQVEYTADGGKQWRVIQTATSGTGQYSWTVPSISSSGCLVAIHDPFGGARGVSGLFAIGIKGDLNADGTVNQVDRRLLAAHLLENSTNLLSGADLNEDGVVDLLDLVYLDTLLARAGAGVPPEILER